MKTERTSSQVLGSSIDNGHTPKQCQIVIYQIIYGGLKARFLLVFSRKMFTSLRTALKLIILTSKLTQNS